jgi:aerobic carbon-monoxide dehydrogenase large subunit
VIAVWTFADISDVPPINLREGRIEQFEPYYQPILARDYVRYVGEPVAVVFAQDLMLQRTRSILCLSK